MREQLDFGAYARRLDPHTSHDAAASVKVTDLEAVVLYALKDIGTEGATSHEVADHVGMDLVTISPRLKPLEKKGLVRRNLLPGWLDTGRLVYQTRPGKSGRQSVVWFAV
jgi:DNA-binding MarR family transcriptional regulator